MKYFLPALLLCIAGLCTRAQDIVLNPSFGNNGLIIKSPEKKDNVFWEQATSVIDLPDGKLLVAVELNSNTILTRHLPDGTLDKTYGEDGFSDPVKGWQPRAVRRKDGKIMTIGIVYAVSTSYFTIALYDDNGKMDATFGNKGVKTISIQQSGFELKTLLLQQDGKLLLAGTMFQANGSTGFVMRLTADAALDATFANGGLLAINVPGVTRLSDLVNNGTKILVGATISNNGENDFGVIQYLENGNPDPQFGENGLAKVNITAGDNVQAIAVQPDGKILAAGAMYHGQNFTVLRLLPTGQLDDTFNGTGVATVNFGDYASPYAHVSHNVRSITIGKNGSITLAGDLQGAVLGLAFASFTSSGSLNLNYGDYGKKMLRYDQTFLNLSGGTLSQEGSLIGAGQYYFYASDFAKSDYLLAKINSDGQPDATFGNKGVKTGYFPAKASYLFLPKLLANGDLLSKYIAFGTETKAGLVRLRPDGTQDQNFGEQGLLKTPGYTFDLRYDLLPDGRIVTFEFERDPSTNIVGLFMYRYTSEGNADFTLGSGGRKLVLSTPNGGGTFNGFIVLPDGRLLLTGTTYNSYSPQQGFLMRLDADGNIDQKFGTEGKALFDGDKREYPLEPVVQPDGRIVIKGIAFTWTGSGNYSFIKRFDSEGKLDESFGTKGVVRMEKPGHINNLFIQSNDKLVASVAFRDENRVITNVLLRYNPDGTLDTEFGEKGSVQVPNTEAALLKNDKILFNNTDALTTGNSNVALMQLNADGSIDKSFGTNGTKFFLLGDANNKSRELSVQSNHVFIAGSRNIGLDQEGLLTDFLILEEKPSDTTIVSFTLVNASTGKDIQELRNGDILDLAKLPGARLNIRTNTNPSTVGSVVFELKGPHSHTQTESLLPYALFGDDMKGRYYGSLLPVGEYTLTATPYKGAKGSGTKGTPLTIRFKVVYPATVSSFTLVNAETDKDILPLKDGDTLNLAALPSLKLNIRANANPDVVGSMVFDLSGAEVRQHTEINAPYALFSNNKTDYFAWTPKVGSYTLTATPHSATQGTGEKGTPQTIRFYVLYPEVQSFTLVNAETGKDIRILRSGDVLDLSTLPTNKLNIRANTTPSTVGSVVFDLSGAETRKQTESLLPYALFGDDMKGKYYDWIPKVGSYTLTTTLYSAKQGNGAKGSEKSIHFTVVGQFHSECDTPNFSTLVSSSTMGTVVPTKGDDFNGDGKLDLVIIKAESSEIGIMLGNGDGTFTREVNYYGGGDGSITTTTGDFNKDGKLDLAVGNINGYPYYSDTSTVGILLGKGDGTFEPAITFSSGGGDPKSIVEGDFNEDGNNDLAISHFSSGSIGVLLGDGTGRFILTHTYQTGGYLYSIKTGDFDKDGKLDLVVTNYGSSTVGVMLGKGDGSFGEINKYPSGGTGPFDIAVADFNADKILDLVVTNFETKNISFLMGKGDGSFGDAVTLLNNSSSLFFFVEDFNRDGQLDLALGVPGGTGILLGKGDGTFKAPAVFLSGQLLTTGDFSGDGRVDLVFTYDTIGVLFNTCGAEASSALKRSSQQSVEVAAAEKPKASLSAYPNPFSSQSIIRFSVANTGYATVGVYDQRGVEVARLYQGQMEGGKEYRTSFEAKGLSSGIYVLRLATEKEIITTKVVLVR